MPGYCWQVRPCHQNFLPQWWALTWISFYSFVHGIHVFCFPFYIHSLFHFYFNLAIHSKCCNNSVCLSPSFVLSDTRPLLITVRSSPCVRYPLHILIYSSFLIVFILPSLMTPRHIYVALISMRYFRLHSVIICWYHVACCGIVCACYGTLSKLLPTPCTIFSISLFFRYIRRSLLICHYIFMCHYLLQYMPIA